MPARWVCSQIGRISRKLTMECSARRSMSESYMAGYGCPSGRTRVTRTRRPHWQPSVLFYPRVLQKVEKRPQIKVAARRRFSANFPNFLFGFPSLPRSGAKSKRETFSALRVRGAERLSIARGCPKPNVNLTCAGLIIRIVEEKRACLEPPKRS